MPNLDASVEYEKGVEESLDDAYRIAGRNLSKALWVYLVSAIVHALLVIAAVIEEK